MRTTYNWLKEYVDIKLSPEELADRLDLTGSEVESLVHVGDGLEKIVVGEVLSIEPHPDADRLTFCKINIGADKPAGIVCGAKNIKAGDLVPVALPGAKLPNGLEIKVSKIRGVESAGMLCSATELELGRDAAGILILPPTAKVGEAVSQTLELDDWLMDIEITPNRPDCLGMIGLAREVAAITGATLRVPKVKVTESAGNVSKRVKVDIDAPDLCGRYVARLLQNVQVGPSPIWLSRRLDAVGIRSINNIVDITNYVMMETGQPLHAFDFDLVKGDRIIVRRAEAGEAIVTIDHVKRKLSPDALIIADAGHPLALAGVMGGFDTEISEKTKTVLIESAAFAPVSIMRTSRSLGLISESSYRFEKGVDAGGALYAADRAAQLMAEVSGAAVMRGAVDNYPGKARARTLKLRPGRVNQVLGTKLSLKTMTGVLNGLGLKVKTNANKDLAVTIPSFRIDLEREVDLIEEVARLYGLNNIPSSLPLSTESARGLSRSQKQERRLRAGLTAAGLDEIVNYSFIDREDMERLHLPGDHPWRKAPKLANPLADDQSLLRTSLLPGLLRTIGYNINRGMTGVNIFEVGTVFRSLPGGAVGETLSAGIAVTGLWQPPQWHQEPRAMDFFDLKGIIEAAGEILGIEDADFRAASHPSFHPGATAELLAEGEVIGLLGRVHPETLSSYGIKQDVFIGQLSVAGLLSHLSDLVAVKEVPRYPGISLDLAFVADEHITNRQIESLIREQGGGLLKEVRLFDLFRGGSLPPDKRSIAYSLTFRSDKRTLTDDEVQKVRERIVRSALQELGATLRK